MLLKNDNNLLPVQSTSDADPATFVAGTAVSSIAIIGPIGDGNMSTEALLGSYSQAPLDPTQVPSIFAAFSNSFKGKVTYTEGASITSADTSGIPAAVAAAQAAGLAVVVVGDSNGSCGEWGDRADLDLAGGQLVRCALASRQNWWCAMIILRISRL